MATVSTRRYDAVVVGAGFSGMYAVYKLRELGMTVRAIETATDVGGTWYWNRYPGARCDVESLDYSYSFSDALQQEWCWTERYASQPEILRYASHVANRFGLREHIDFETTVQSAQFDRATNTWHVVADRASYDATFLIMAGGCLSVPQLPDIEGRERYQGRIHHTGRWPKEGVDFRGARVGVVGTGSSGIQVIPEIARDAAQLVVFQRTANFSAPAANAPLAAEFDTWYKAHYQERREKARHMPAGSASHVLPSRNALDDGDDARMRRYQEAWDHGGTTILRSYRDILTSERANETLAAFVRHKIAALVKDEATAARLTPQDHPIGAKRLCLNTDYYETFNRGNVTLVDLRAEPIARITSTGIQTRAREFALDHIVFATGYDAVTGSLLAIDISVKDGPRLADTWAQGPTAYLGLMTAGFPNLFLVTGPGSPSVLANMVACIEQHVEWIADCLRYLKGRGLSRIEADPAHERAWVETVNRAAGATLMPRANSWYMGANIPGKPRVFLAYVGGLGAYRVHCADVAFNHYEGFVTGT